MQIKNGKHDIFITKLLELKAYRDKENYYHIKVADRHIRIGITIGDLLFPELLVGDNDYGRPIDNDELLEILKELNLDEYVEYTVNEMWDDMFPNGEADFSK